MTRESRRTYLSGIAGVVALSAGCLDEAGAPSSNDDNGGNGGGTDDGDGNGGESDDGDEPEPGGTGESDDGATADLEGADNLPFSYSAVPTDPDAELFVRGDRATAWLDERGLEDEEYASFVDDTEFDEAVLVALEADAPNLCYGMALEDGSVEEGSIEITGAVRDDSADDVGCGQAETTVGQLVRATTGDEGPTVSVTIVDRDGREHGFGMAADSDSESVAEDDAGT